MSKFVKFIDENWYLLVIFGAALCLGIVALSVQDQKHEYQKQAEKLCYPYVILAQTDEIVVCAGIEKPVVKNRK